jgi:Mannosyltransferase (PIG-V)
MPPNPEVRELAAEVSQTTLGVKVRVWAQGADVQTALWATVGLRLLTTGVAASVPLLMGDVYPWLSPYSQDGFHFSLSGLTGPHPAYAIGDYLTQPWNRWDTGWYTLIAEHGYAKYGTTAFMPLYPLLLRLMGPFTGNNFVLAGLLVTTVAAFFAFLGLFRLAEDLFPARHLGRNTVFVVCLLPVSCILMAAYTEALFLALSTWSIVFALQKQWWPVALLGAGAALTRQQGILIGMLALPAIAVSVMRVLAAARTQESVPRLGRTIAALASPLTSALAPAVSYGLWAVALKMAGLPPAWTVMTAPRAWNLRVAWPWVGLWNDLLVIVSPASALHAHVLAVASACLDLGMALAALALLLALARKLPLGLTLYLAALWCTSLSKVASSGITASAGRYMLQLAPLCIAPAAWMAAGGGKRRIVWLALALPLSVLCLWAFTLYLWTP